jgi:hypothetical protein
MISDALTETAVEEAERIVRAEWMRLHRDTVPHEQARRAACCEMPAARTHLVTVPPMTAIDERSRPAPGWRAGWPRRGGPQRRVWPTQRSPPRRRMAERH